MVLVRFSAISAMMLISAAPGCCGEHDEKLQQHKQFGELFEGEDLKQIREMAESDDDRCSLACLTLAEEDWELDGRGPLMVTECEAAERESTAASPWSEEYDEVYIVCEVSYFIDAHCD